ncbi:pectinesterase 3-like [Cornus florida]|uniref:pectinesterase 3-like n=1 Tax=Cornus florida TaxID=4283 RepID=UPI00289ECBFD|nr:pectinesterase 3-like [Cornus florida]
MDQFKSIRAYCKVDEHDEQAFRRKTRNRFICIGVATLVLVCVIIGVVFGVKNSNSDGVSASPMTTSASIKAVCNMTHYPDSCFKSISALEASNPTTDPKEIFKLSLHAALNELVKVSSLPDTLISKISDEQAKKALIVCRSVFEDAVDSLNDSISLMAENDGEKLLSPSRIEDARTWLTAALTYHDTCLETLKELNSTTATTLYNEVNGLIENATEFSSNSLAIVTKVLGSLSDYNIPAGRKLLGFPEWVSSGDRRLLQETKLRPSVTVAQDGSGDVKTIKEAVAMIPKKSKTRFLIYVKAGKYVENVKVEKSMWNVMIYGDGKWKTIISGSLNVMDGTRTYDSATLAADGWGFFAKDITFQNTAGPQKHQAVALRSSSDSSVFYRCSFDGFQDTLYTHCKRQFYRDCDITGTVDFIFGNAAVVFQNCKIQPRQPMENQYVTITAQGRKDDSMNSGISIQKCSITPLNRLTAPTFLGRPWKDYSTTVIMQTYIGSFLHPSGWIEWVPNVAPPKTIFYGEFYNRGPGAVTNKRVDWAHKKLTTDQAKKFTVEAFLRGSEWLPATRVFYEPAL